MSILSDILAANPPTCGKCKSDAGRYEEDRNIFKDTIILRVVCGKCGASEQVEINQETLSKATGIRGGTFGNALSPLSDDEIIVKARTQLAGLHASKCAYPDAKCICGILGPNKLLEERLDKQVLDFEIESTPLEGKTRKLKVDRRSAAGNPIIKTDKGDVELVPGTRRIGVGKKDELPPIDFERIDPVATFKVDSISIVDPPCMLCHVLAGGGYVGPKPENHSPDCETLGGDRGPKAKVEKVK